MMAQTELKLKSAASAILISALFVTAMFTLFEPVWQTNDDVGMSMMAHGYGIAAQGSPTILFSNVIWGYIVRALPTIQGIVGYSLATVTVLFVNGAVLLYFLLSRGLGWILSLSIFSLIMIYPTLFCQFTVNSGLLFVSAFLLLREYAESRYRLLLVSACFLAVMSYLIRAPEFLLLLIVALPLLPWKTLVAKRSAKLAVATVTVFVAFAALMDYRAYTTDKWEAFSQLNPQRAAFTDYRAAISLKQRPDIMQRHGYTANDVDLIENWFFVDSKIADPVTLKAMLDELGPLKAQGNAISYGLSGIAALWKTPLLGPLAAALVLLAAYPSRAAALSWAICGVLIFIMGVMGRPGILHVYIPLVSFLVIVPMFAARPSGHRKLLLTLMLPVIALANAGYAFSLSKNFEAVARQVRSDLAGFPKVPIVIWGVSFPYEAVYPVLRASSDAMNFRHYGMGTSTLAPFTVAYAENEAGRSVIDLLSSQSGVQMMADENYVRLLGIYCQERLHGKLVETSRAVYGARAHFGAIAISTYRCEVA